MRIGFIGLGKMGEGMAERLLAAGHSLTVYNRTAAKAAKLKDKGALVADTPAAAATGAEAVITMLADDAALEETVFGDRGVLAALPQGAVHVSMSTISVALSRRLAEAHAAARQRYVAAPVFGRPQAAHEGKLYIVVSGDADAARAVEPLFGAMGQRTYQMGADPAAANIVKLSGNFLIQVVLEGLAEAFALVRKAGVDVHAFREMLISSLFNAPVVHTYSGLVESGKDDVVGFGAPLALKDVRLALTAAEALRVPMPFASTVRDAFVSALARGYENRDMSVLGRIAAENAGLR
jgi:3-hydroxyisobutyrate dehydrogenase-like beta-hydroxyacid dehydrogenase